MSGNSGDLRVAATFTIRGLPKMDRKKRERVAKWLSAQRRQVLGGYNEVANRFTARIYTREP